VRKAENLPPPYADVKKSGGLNLLEPCGPVQACNETAFTFNILLFLSRRKTLCFLRATENTKQLNELFGQKIRYF
jgi:hypothetical protein